MAELATLARPYAEALFKVAVNGDVVQISEQLDALAAVAANPQLRQYAGNPNASVDEVFDVITSVVTRSLGDATKNLLKTVLGSAMLFLTFCQGSYSCFLMESRRSAWAFASTSRRRIFSAPATASEAT